jgi:hypothetical protein
MCIAAWRWRGKMTLDERLQLDKFTGLSHRLEN